MYDGRWCVVQEKIKKNREPDKVTHCHHPSETPLAHISKSDDYQWKSIYEALGPALSQTRLGTTPRRVLNDLRPTIVEQEDGRTQRSRTSRRAGPARAGTRCGRGHVN